MEDNDLIVTLIGKSNVGKSSIFNRILKSNYSLISDKPGLTIDRKYGSIIFKNKIIKFVDTGAILDFPKREIYEKVLNQIIFSIKESNIILFIIDGKIGITNDDYKILNFLNEFKKKILIIINKIDLIKKNSFYFNFKNITSNNIIYISSLLNKGIKDILNKILDNYGSYNKKIIKSNNINCNIIKISVIGKQNVGKSTLINTILNENRLITSSKPGTTKDSIDIDFNFSNIDFKITDTSGITDINFFSKNINLNYIDSINLKVIKNIKISNIIIFVTDIITNLTNKDLLVINYLIKIGKPVLILVNKCDLIDKNKFYLKKEYFVNKLKFAKYLNIYLISALYKTNIKIILKSIKYIYDFFNKKIKVNFLNKILINSIKFKKPNLIANKLIKVKFCNVINNNPIKIIIYGKNLNLLEERYKRYLINCFYKNIKYKNIPIFLIYKNYN